MTSPAFERFPGAERKAQILAAAMRLARKKGYRAITRDAVAKEAAAAQGLVNLYFGNMAALREEVIKEAVKTEDLKIIAQAIANADRHALKAPPALRKRALAALAA